MKSIFTLLFFLISCTLSLGQSHFIHIETNKTLCLFNFLETSSGQVGTSYSFRAHIFESYEQDTTFNELINAYAALNLEYTFHRNDVPQTRSYNSIKDLLWITASNAKDIDDFNQRIIGFLPHQTQVQLIAILKKIEPYYNDLVWHKEQANIRNIQNQLEDYKDQIRDLYLKISQFYNTSWDMSIPFKIMLYPIPLKTGSTTAIPKGNALICGFLSHNDKDYKSILGISIHEMCHILYKAQHPEFQQQLDQWFTNSNSPFAPLAYSFINEGLATVLGNGWAYQQIHKTLDTGAWYNNTHIDGFAHALFPLVERYLNANKSINQDFVNEAIAIFQDTFPRAIEDTNILMNTIQLFANTEHDDEIQKIVNTIHNYFNIRSMGLSTPINSSAAIDRFYKKGMTKLFIVDSNNEQTITELQRAFPELNIQTPLNSIGIFKSKKTQSTLVIMNLSNLEVLDKAYQRLSNIPYLEHGKTYQL